MSGSSVEQPVTRAGMPTLRSTAASRIAVPVQEPPFITICCEDICSGLLPVCHLTGSPAMNSRSSPCLSTITLPP